MTEAIYGWIRNLAYTLLFFTVVLQLVPEGGYRKYIRYFLGLILIVTVISPVFSLFSSGSSIETMLGQVLELSSSGGNQAADEGEEIAAFYRQEAAAIALEGQLEVLLGEEGLSAAELDLDLELREDGRPEELWILAVPEEKKGQITAGSARGAPEAAETEAGEIKKRLSEVYELEEDHIHISIRE